MLKGRFALDAAPVEQGHFGTVYRAVDTQQAASAPRARVALWKLPPEIVGNAPAFAALRRDLERIRQLSHPHITRVFGIDRDGDETFVTAELADGETLRNVLDALGLGPRRSGMTPMP